MKKIVALLLLFSLLLPIGANAAQKDPFEDVPFGHWAFEDIQRLYDLKVFIGYNDGKFKPENNITRAEFIKIMSLLSIRDVEEGADLSFLDKFNLSDHWAYGYVQLAAEKGILNMHDATTDIDLTKINGNITRAEMALIMARAFKEDVMAYDAPLKDVKEINEKHKDAIFKMFKKEIIKGYPDDNFRPYNNSTRAEASVVINRYIKSLNLSDADLKIKLEKGLNY